jgi:hypothetical protein
MDRVELAKFIRDKFNDSELRDLCFELHIDYESLPGEGKAAKARELVSFCERRDRLSELERAARQVLAAEAQSSVPAADRAQEKTSLQRQLAEARENLRLIEDRKAEYVLDVDVPLQLVKEERRLRDKIAELEGKLRG